MAPSSPEDPFECPALSDTLRALARRGLVKVYRRKGMLLIQEGDHDDTLFIVLAGRARAFAGDDNGREIFYRTYGPGEYFGEMNLDGGPRSASVVTLEACICAVVTRHALQEHIAEFPLFAFDLIDKVIRVAREATLAMRKMALSDVYGRMVDLLNSLAVVQPDGTRLIAERITHHEIASQIGCSREMVSRLMKDLFAGAYVALDTQGRLVLMRALPPRH